jgi:hypothetical protein
MHVSDHAAAPTRRLYDAAFFVALLATALALGPALAHVLELPNKIDLPREPYFTVQGIYRGWWQIAFVLAVELAGMLAVLVLSREHPAVFRLTLLAISCLAAAQAVFWIWTQPANVETENWTVAPDNWQTLRLQWEFSHLAGAVFQLMAFGSLVAAALTSRRPSDIAAGDDGTR